MCPSIRPAGNTNINDIKLGHASFFAALAVLWPGPVGEPIYYRLDIDHCSALQSCGPVFFLR
jgi:hypothetical protein